MTKPEIKRGARFDWGGGEVRVMAVADGYAMVRRPGCVPFVLFLKDIVKAHATERAVCVRETEDGPDVWLPLSAVEIEGDERRGRAVTLTGPVRLLQDKGLL